MKTLFSQTHILPCWFPWSPVSEHQVSYPLFPLVILCYTNMDIESLQFLPALSVSLFASPVPLMQSLIPGILSLQFCFILKSRTDDQWISLLQICSFVTVLAQQFLCPKVNSVPCTVLIPLTQSITYSHFSPTLCRSASSLWRSHLHPVQDLSFFPHHCLCPKQFHSVLLQGCFCYSTALSFPLLLALNRSLASTSQTPLPRQLHVNE